MEVLELKGIRLTWLNGGVTHLDGGAMFGVVPKPLWSKKYPVNEQNQIELRTDPILIQMNGKNILVETGIGKGKLTEKQKRNYGVFEESELENNLTHMGLTFHDIDYVLMTHMHFDHACGLTTYVNGEYVSTFPNAEIITSKVEWEEMRQPNIRSRNTYWKENWQAIENQVTPFEGEWSLGEIKMVHTGGHSDGHSILLIEQVDQVVIHMADLMPTHAHEHVLWVMAYDDYPMDSISAKQEWMEYGRSKQAWFTFYHDAHYRAIKWDEEGSVLENIERKMK
ncbi:MBL fold metallo-hydrolase [Cytobacillus spongiae]|uniref:YtnP family quorum-quenching lactonase n=1 Tax=Cytobacillus spongiae TaxID=2901381 RepID=UPI001F16658C|nr:MBL fold metallo-hydrolase [Cytobacillus spongiae]UII55237.1 MBL fold metallo-hydrolase [Cytobacillus spongiae]